MILAYLLSMLPESCPKPVFIGKLTAVSKMHLSVIIFMVSYVEKDLIANVSIVEMSTSRHVLDTLLSTAVIKVLDSKVVSEVAVLLIIEDISGGIRIGMVMKTEVGVISNIILAGNITGGPLLMGEIDTEIIVDGPVILKVVVDTLQEVVRGIVEGGVLNLTVEVQAMTDIVAPLPDVV